MDLNITRTRRINAIALYREFAQQQVQAGSTTNGLEQLFAQKMQISPSMWSQVKNNRPISDKLARQMEHHTHKASGWMDTEHPELDTPDETEQYFLGQARLAWRKANAQGKRALLKMVKEQ